MTPRVALVLGASGFIGRWVVRRLLADGARVFAVVRESPDLRSQAQGERVETVTADLAISGVARSLVDGLRPTHVFNLAGYGVDRSERDHRLAAQLNHRLPDELAQACSERGKSRGAVLIHAGSAAEYGSVRGIVHEHGEVQPGTVYGRTKLAGTQAIARAAAAGGARAMTARLFTVFGPGEHEGRLLPSLRHAAAGGEPVDLTDGTQTRDFAFVDDVARALLHLADSSFTAGEVVNIASGRLHTVRAFGEAVARASGMSGDRLRWGALPARPDEMHHQAVSVDRMVALLGYSLSPDLDEIVGRALAISP